MKAGRASFDLGVASGPLGGGADDNSSEGRRQGVASRREGVMLLDWALGTIGRASPLPAINTGINQINPVRRETNTEKEESKTPFFGRAPTFCC